MFWRKKEKIKIIPQGQTPPEVASLISDIIKDKIVCDVGCGEGNFMEALKPFCKEVFGIEEDVGLAELAKEKGFGVGTGNTFFYELPKADVYYLWTKDEMGVFLKAQFEKVHATFILGHSERYATKRWLESLKAEVREINNFKVYIITI